MSYDGTSPFLLTRVATLLAQLGRTQEARKYLEKGKEAHPSDRRILNLLADLYAVEGKEDKVVEIYHAIISQEPNAIEGYLHLARFFLGQKNLDRAIDAVEKGVEADPSSYLGPYNLAKLYVHQAAYEKGVEQYKKALSLYPAFEPAHLELGSLYERLGQMDRAEELYRKMMTTPNMEHGEAGLRLVDLLMERKVFDEATEILHRLLETDPDNTDIWLKQSFLLARQEQFAEAVKALQPVLARQPHSADLMTYLASLYEGMGHYDKAIAIYQTLLQQGGNPYEIHLRLSSLYADRLKKVPEALSEVEQAKKIDPKRPEAYLLMGKVLQEAQRFSEAAQHLEEGVAALPGVADLHFYLGTVYDKLNRFEEMVSEMEKVIALDPKHAIALNYLGYTYADRGIRLSEAVDLIHRALTLRPDDGYFVDSLGWAYYQQGKVEEALILLQKAAALVLDDPVILEHLGAAYLKDNQRDLAKETWIRALQLDSKNETLKTRLREESFQLHPEASCASLDKKDTMTDCFFNKAAP